MGKPESHDPTGAPQGEKASSGLTGGPRRKHVRAGEFKATCLKLVDRVQETGEEIIIITKRNRPVAKLAPIEGEKLRPFVGRSRGVISATREDLLAPISEDWEVDADL